MPEITPDTQIGSDGVRYPTGTQPTDDPGWYGPGSASTEITGTSYTLAQSNLKQFLYTSAAGAVTIVMPTNDVVPLPVDFECVIYADGAGGVTLTTSGLTLLGSSPQTTIAQNEAVYVKKIAVNTWSITPIGAGGGGGGGGLSNVVEDTTPQLGGDLDAQGNDVVNVGSIRYNVNTVASSGATETLVLGINNVTMSENCTFTFPSATSGDYDTFTLFLSGAFTPSWPASVDWPSGLEPIYTSPTEYNFSTYDGGTTWLGVGSTFAAEVTPSYHLIRFTSSGTFTKADYPWARTLKATIIGGGGGGGGAGATTAGQGSCGGGGAGGASAIAYFNLSSLGASSTVTVGTGGAGGVGAANGSTGGTSSFGTVDALGGGGGGFTAASTTFPNLSLGGDGQDVVGTGLPTVLLTTPGGGGGFGFVGGVSVSQAFGGHGGGTLIASPTDDRRAGGEGPTAGNNYGGGGSGAANVPSTSATNGGAGANGIVIIELYA